MKLIGSFSNIYFFSLNPSIAYFCNYTSSLLGYLAIFNRDRGYK